jgi:hypothetical protein
VIGAALFAASRRVFGTADASFLGTFKSFIQETSIMRKIVVALLFLALLPVAASAEQYVAPSGQVVHTRVGPVVVHRVLPPFRGVHVYQGRFRR